MQAASSLQPGRTLSQGGCLAKREGLDISAESDQAMPVLGDGCSFPRISKVMLVRAVPLGKF